MGVIAGDGFAHGIDYAEHLVCIVESARALSDCLTSDHFLSFAQVAEMLFNGIHNVVWFLFVFASNGKNQIGERRLEGCISSDAALDRLT